MILVDIKRANAGGGVINGGVLEAPDLPPLLSDKSHKLTIHLDMMARDGFPPQLQHLFS